MPWKIAISDSYCTWSYEMEISRKMSIEKVAKKIARMFKTEATNPKLEKRYGDKAVRM